MFFWNLCSLENQAFIVIPVTFKKTSLSTHRLENILIVHQIEIIQ